MHLHWTIVTVMLPNLPLASCVDAYLSVIVADAATPLLHVLCVSAAMSDSPAETPSCCQVGHNDEA